MKNRATPVIIEPDARISLDEREYTSDMSPWRFGEPTDSYTGAQITLERNAYDVSDVEYQEPFFEKYRTTISASLILLILGIILGYGLMKRELIPRRGGPSADQPEPWGERREHESPSNDVFPTESDELKNPEQTEIPDDPDSFDGTVEWEDPDT